MKNLLLLLFVVITNHSLLAQPTVTISSGTLWVSSSGSFTNLNGLVLQPASAYTIPANILSRNSTPAPLPPFTCIQRVYQSQSALPAYTGNLIFHYEDTELNGLNENQLVLAVYSNATGSWSYFAPAVNDPVANTFTVNGLSNLSMQQVTLVSDLALPVAFGTIEAKVTGDTLQVAWQTLNEKKTSSFDIEASVDGKKFSKIGSIATKASGGQSDEAISYSIRIPAQQLPEILGMLGVALLLAGGFKNRKRRLVRINVTVTALLAGAILLHSCKKESPELPLAGNKIYVRIVQVDTDGKKMYSKIVRVHTDQ